MVRVMYEYVRVSAGRYTYAAVHVSSSVSGARFRVLSMCLCGMFYIFWLCKMSHAGNDARR